MRGRASPVLPVLSVVIPTHDNVEVLRQCLDSWRRFGGEDAPFELIVVEDGCADGTPDLLAEVSATTWGGRHLRWVHTDDVHELRCTNAGLAAGRAPLLMAWQDDMFLRARWLVPEMLRVFERCADIGLLSLGRGLDHHPSADPIDSWDALNDWSRVSSTIGPRGWNWVRLQECDSVIRPWIVRRACLDRVGPLDDAFVPTEWDEADLSFRIRDAGWKVATCGYERLGAYEHLGSSTVGTLSGAYRARVLKNGRLFHARWDAAIARDHARRRRTWPRPQTPRVWAVTCAAAVRTGWRRLARAPWHPGTLAPWHPGTWHPGTLPPVAAPRAEPYRRAELHELIAARLPSTGLAGAVRRRLGPIVARCLSIRRAPVARLPFGEQVAIARTHRHITWNPAEYTALRAATRPGDVVLDLGANVGAYAVLFGQWVGPSGHVYAFEPDARAAAGLRQHIALNRLERRVTPIERAVLDRGSGAVPFRRGASSGLGRVVRRPPDEGAVDYVPACSIDEFCERERVAPAVMKIDVEGSELRALAGARRTIAAAGSRLAIFVEMHPALWSESGDDLQALQHECERQRLVPEPIDGSCADVWTTEGICVRLRRREP